MYKNNHKIRCTTSAERDPKGKWSFTVVINTFFDSFGTFESFFNVLVPKYIYIHTCIHKYKIKTLGLTYLTRSEQMLHNPALCR